jgi:hypothetical protein
MKELAAGSMLEDGPTGHHLSWSDGEATFYDRSDAVIFSWVIDAEPAAIVELSAPERGATFDLGLARDHRRARTAAGPCHGPARDRDSACRRREVDRVTVDAVLSELGWDRCTRSEADVLRGWRPRVGRAIAYRQSQFVYEW